MVGAEKETKTVARNVERNQGNRGFMKVNGQ